MQRSLAVRQKRYGNSEGAVISEAVWAQGSWRRYTGSAITIPNTLVQEMQYAGHIGMPRGRSLPLLFGIYTRRTDLGWYSPSCSFLERWWIRVRSLSSAVSLSIPGVRLPLFLRISSQAWASHSSEVKLSQRSVKRFAWLLPASLFKCSISFAMLITDCSVV